MSRVITTTMIILIVIKISMIKWMRTTTITNEQPLSNVKMIELEVWTFNMCTPKGHFLLSINSELKHNLRSPTTLPHHAKGPKENFPVPSSKNFGGMGVSRTGVRVSGGSLKLNAG